MHELSLVTALLEQLAMISAREKAQRVHRVRVKVGALSGVDRAALEFSFELAREDTAFAETELVVEPAPVEKLCRSCQLRFQPATLAAPCPRCRSAEAEVVAGHEFTIATVELEVPGD